MKLDRLFNALVLGGAALGLAACTHDTGGGGGEGGTSTSTSGGNGSGGSGAGGTDATSGSGGAGGGGVTSGSGGAGGSGVTSGSGGTGGSSGQCSMPPGDPADPCGCPCCWATGCLNTEPCCAGFCSAGNNGAGCCGG